MSDCCGGKNTSTPFNKIRAVEKDKDLKDKDFIITCKHAITIGLTKNSGHISIMCEFPLHALTNHNTLCIGPRNWISRPIN